MPQRWMVLLVSSLGLAACSQRSPAPPDPPTSQVTPAAPPPVAPTPPVAPAPAAPAGHAANVEPGTPVAAPTGGSAEAHEHGEHEHGEGEHSHGSPHGGVVMSVPGGHIEARLEPSGRITVWLLDAHEQSVSAQGASGRVRLAVSGAADAPLAFHAQSNALVGQVLPPARDHVVGIVTVTRPGGQPTNVRFAFHLEAGGH